MNTTTTFSDQSRIWIYQSDRDFSAEEAQAIEQQVAQFAEQWVSHSRELIAHGELRHGRFLLLMVDDVNGNGASGCSIDASVHFVRALGDALQVDFFNRLDFAYYDEDQVKVAHKSELPGLYLDKKITDQTLFFDNLIKTKGDLDQRWMVPLGQSWHKRFI